AGNDQAVAGARPPPRLAGRPHAVPCGVVRRRAGRALDDGRPARRGGRSLPDSRPAPLRLAGRLNSRRIPTWRAVWSAFERGLRPRNLSWGEVRKGGRSPPPSLWMHRIRCAVPYPARDSPPFLLHAPDRIHDIGIEVRGLLREDHPHRLVVGNAILVDALAHQGVVDVDDRDQAPGDGDLIAHETARVATAVPALVMGVD